MRSKQTGEPVAGLLDLAVGLQRDLYPTFGRTMSNFCIVRVY
jgi:hypothetical protein